MEVLQDTYKDTKIGRIPKDWNFDKLSNLISLKHGYQFRTDDFTEYGIAIIKINNITGGELDTQNLSFIDSNRLNEFKGFKLFEGDILMSLTGNIGKVIEIKNLNGIYLQNYRVGKFTSANESVLHKSLLKYILSSKLVMNQLSRFSNQSAQANFGKQDLDKIWFGISNNLDEQQKIAAILTTVDEQISTTDKIIEKSKELKKGLMQKLFSEGIGHTEFKDTKIGRIPKDWELSKVGEICDVKGGKRVPKGHKLVDVKTDFPYIRVADMSMMNVNTSKLLYLHRETQELIKRYVISKDDIFVSVAGTVGIIGVIPELLDGANLTENADKLCNLNGVHQLFLAYLLSSNVGQKQIESYIGVGAQPKLALARLKKILIPLPYISEQQKIAAILSEADAKIEKEQTQKVQLQALKKGLMQELLTGKKRVKV